MFVMHTAFISSSIICTLLSPSVKEVEVSFSRGLGVSARLVDLLLAEERVLILVLVRLLLHRERIQADKLGLHLLLLLEALVVEGG